MTDTASAVDADAATSTTRDRTAWVAVAVLVATVCGVITYLARADDGMRAEVSMLAESGGRISGFDRALAAADALRATPEVRVPPQGVDVAVVRGRPGAAVFDIRVEGSSETVVAAHAATLAELVEAASRDEEVRILESQLQELEATLAELDPDGRQAERIRGDIEVREGQLAVLTGLIRRVGPVTTDEVPVSPLRDGLVVAVVVGVGLVVAVPRLLDPGS